jgi:hypothetical protein
MDAWLTTLDRLPDLNYRPIVAGHGAPVTDPAPLAAATADRLRKIRDLTLSAPREPREPYDVLRAVAAHYRITFTAPQFCPNPG